MMNKLGKNWQWKIVCLLVAIVLWFVVINEQNPTSEGSYTVPVAVQNLDPQYIASDVPKNIYVRISGPRNTIVNLAPTDIKAYIDLSDVEEGEMTAPIHIDIPQGTELKKQSAKTAKIRIDVYAVQEFALVTEFKGKLESNLSISEMKIVPEKIIVSGARRLINLVDKAVIEVPIGGHDKDFSVMSPIKLLQKDGTEVEGLQVTPRQISVKVALNHNAATKRVPVNLITSGVPDSNVKLKQIVIQPKEIEIRGTKDAVEALNQVNLDPINIDGIVSNREWEVMIPPIGGILMTPDKVKVLVEVDQP